MNASTRGPDPAPLDPVERLLAVEAIKELKARYFRTLDTKDWVGFGETFTVDAVMDMRAEIAFHGEDQAGELLSGRDPILRGRDVITAFVSGALAGVVSVHHGHMPEIEVLGPDTARGVCAMFDYLDHGGTGMRGFGHYHEAYRRVDGRWYIEHLELRRLRVDRF